MTIHLPGRTAAPAEIVPDLARILAEQAEREAAEKLLHAKNKEALFDGLRQASIAHVLVSFDGSGDSGQIESIDARNDTDQSVTLPEAQITFAGIDWQTGAPTERRLTLEGAVEELVYDLLSAGHPFRLAGQRRCLRRVLHRCPRPDHPPRVQRALHLVRTLHPRFLRGQRWHIRITTRSPR